MRGDGNCMGMNELHLAKWNNVNDHLPNDSDYKIVRCINSDEEYDFYFMAYYYEEEKKWEFFDEQYEGRMQVTHWLRTPRINFDIKFGIKNE